MEELVKSIKKEDDKYVLYLPIRIVRKIVLDTENFSKIPINLEVAPDLGIIRINNTNEKLANNFLYNNNDSFRIIFRRHDIVSLWGENSKYPVIIKNTNGSIEIRHKENLIPPGILVYSIIKHLLMDYDKLRRMYSKYGNEKDTNRRRSKFIRNYNKKIKASIVEKEIKDLINPVSNPIKEEAYFTLLDEDRRGKKEKISQRRNEIKKKFQRAKYYYVQDEEEVIDSKK